METNLKDNSLVARNRQVTCWVVTDGKAGHENQSVAIAHALGIQPVIKRIILRQPWDFLMPWLRVGLGYAFAGRGDKIAPPWPDLLIACGRPSLAASLYVRKMNPKTVIVQLQNPVISPTYFDLVVAPKHDGLVGANVIGVMGSVCFVPEEKLRAAGDRFRARFASLGKPLVAVLIGGASGVYKFSEDDMRVLADRLATLAKTGAGLMITPSRRTGAAQMQILRDRLKNEKVFIWDGLGDNPYMAMLSLADNILVTGDSVNMVTESCYTGKPVQVIDLAGGSKKFNDFHKMFYDAGYTRPFNGGLEYWSYTPPQEMQQILARVQDLLNKQS